MFRTIIFSCLLFLSQAAFCQYLPGEVQKVAADSSWYLNLDAYQKQELEQWIANYNKAIDYYNGNDFESANFYFEKGLGRSVKELFSKSFWTGSTKNNSTTELSENIYFFKYICYLHIPNIEMKELERGFNKVKTHCPPPLTRIAITKTDEYNAPKKKNQQINYKQFLE